MFCAPRMLGFMLVSPLLAFVRLPTPARRPARAPSSAVMTFDPGELTPYRSDDLELEQLRSELAFTRRAALPVLLGAGAVSLAAGAGMPSRHANFTSHNSQYCRR